MPENILKVNDQNFNIELARTKLPLLVDFWAPWCAPCKAINPYIEIIEKKFIGKIKVAKLNIDENPQIAKKFAISSIPTLLFFKNSIPIDQIIGAVSQINIEEMINKHIN